MGIMVDTVSPDLVQSSSDLYGPIATDHKMIAT